MIQGSLLPVCGSMRRPGRAGGWLVIPWRNGVFLWHRDGHRWKQARDIVRLVVDVRLWNCRWVYNNRFIVPLGHCSCRWPVSRFPFDGKKRTKRQDLDASLRLIFKRNSPLSSLPVRSQHSTTGNPAFGCPANGNQYGIRFLTDETMFAILFVYRENLICTTMRWKQRLWMYRNL